MKKIWSKKLILLLGIILIPVFVFATNVEVSENEQTVTWTIPTEITFDSTGYTEITTSFTNTTEGNQKYSSLLFIDDDPYLRHENDNSVTISYTVSDTNGSIESGDEILNDISGSTTLYIQLDDFLDKKPGNYEGSVTFELTITNVVEMPTKGNFVTLDNDNSIYYRVLKTEGTNALLLRMNKLTTSKFNTTSTTVGFENGSSYQKYAGSNLDTAMTTYYNGLSDNIEAAIVPQIIKQSAVSTSTGTPSGNYLMKGTYDTNNTAYYLTKISEVSIGSRYVYALDLEDVRDYLGQDGLSMANINTMFYNSTSSLSYYSWLRSANSNGSNRAFGVNGYYGRLTIYSSSIATQARPAFVINLSNVQFTEIDPTTISPITLGWYTSTSQNFGNHMYIDHVRTQTETEGNHNWEVTMEHKGVITSFSLGDQYNGNNIESKYNLFAKASNSDSWTQLATGISAGTTTSISDTTEYQYLKLQAYNGPSYGIWEEPAGFYWYLAASNFVVNYNY